MSVQNNTNTAAHYHSCQSYNPPPKSQIDQATETLNKYFEKFDNAGAWLHNRDDGEIHTNDLHHLKNHENIEIRNAANILLQNAAAFHTLDSAADGKADGKITRADIAAYTQKMQAAQAKQLEEAKKAEEAKKSQPPAPNQGSSDSFEPKKQEGTPQTEAPKRPGCGHRYQEKTIKATEHALQTLFSVLNALQMAQNGGSTATGPQIKESLKQIAQDPNTPQGIAGILKKVISHPMFDKALNGTTNVGQGTAPSLPPSLPSVPNSPAPSLPSVPNSPTPSLPSVPNGQPSAPSSPLQRGDGPITKEQYGMLEDANKRVEDLKQKLNNSGKVQSQIRELEQQMSKETDKAKKDALQEQINKLKESGGDREMLMMEYKEAMQQKEQMFQFLMSILSHQDKMFQSFIQNLR
ncbi:hypothetical protein L6R29_09075 [Myxococcota bacterium]|nr:hypothetical protein [Myxococcota bacterium]